MSASQQIRTAATAYRAVRKACRTLFAGDAAGLEKALAETRFRFYENAAVSADKVPGLVDDAHETAFFLLENVAQTQMNERGNYEMRPRKEHMHEGTAPPPVQPHEPLNL